MYIPVEVKDTIVVAVDSMIKTSSQRGFWDYFIPCITILAPFLVLLLAYRLQRRKETMKEEKSIKRQKADQYEFLYEDFKRIELVIQSMLENKESLNYRLIQIDLMPIHVLFQNTGTPPRAKRLVGIFRSPAIPDLAISEKYA